MSSAVPSQRSLRRALGLVPLLASVLVIGGVAAVAAPRPSPTPDPKKVSTFGVAPASATAVDGRPGFFYSASPGANLTDHVAVVNSGVSPVVLAVYPSGAIPNTQGEFTLAAVKDSRKDVGGWLSLSGTPTRLTIPGRTIHGPTARILTLRMHVPSNASPGDHAGAIVASLESAALSPSGQKFKLLQRVAARVFVRVSGPLHPALTVENLRPSYEGHLNPLRTGRTKLKFTIHNTGNVKLGGRVTVTVHGLFGSTERVTLPDLPLLIPGSAAPQSLTVSGVYPEVLMKASVTVDAIAAPGDVDPPRRATTTSRRFWAIPWILLAILVLALLAAVRSRQRRRSRVGSDSNSPIVTSSPPRGRHAAPARSRRRVASS